jgi:hypothetical protein
MMTSAKRRRRDSGFRVRHQIDHELLLYALENVVFPEELLARIGLTAAVENEELTRRVTSMIIDLETLLSTVERRRSLRPKPRRRRRRVSAYAARIRR